MRRAIGACARAAIGVGLTLGLWIVGPRPGSADMLFSALDGERDPLRELSYEVIVEPGSELQATLRIRTTLFNQSAETHEWALDLSLPHGSELVGLSAGLDGDLIEGRATDDLGRAAEGPLAEPRVWARLRRPTARGGLPAVELFGAGLPSESTLQVELTVRAPISIRGDRSELTLPRRGDRSPALARERRVVMRGLGNRSFWVDDGELRDTLFTSTRSDDAVTVAWRTAAGGRPVRGALVGTGTVAPDPFAPGGRFRLVLQAGRSPRLEPDHVTLLFDRSSSMGGDSLAGSAALADALFDQLGPGATFSAFAFAREVEPLVVAGRGDGGPADRWARADDRAARAQLEAGLAAAPTRAGTDLRAALERARAHLRERAAKRPLIVVVTDGVVPISALDADLLALGPGLRRAELLFVVDDPLAGALGAQSDRPAAVAAGRLGARMQAASLHDRQALREIDWLASPVVISDLELALPAGAELDAPLPHAIVAGTPAVIDGRFEGRRAGSVAVRGRAGRARVGARVTLATRRQPIAVWVAPWAPGPWPETEPLETPSWYSRQMRARAIAVVERASLVRALDPGVLDPKTIRRELRARVYPRAKACYAQALVRDPRQRGRVLLEYEVGRGEVMTARMSQAELGRPDPSFEACLLEAAWALAVPAALRDTQTYAIRYPLVFEPPEDAPIPIEREGPSPEVEALLRR